MIDSHIVSAGTFVRFANMEMDRFPMPSTHHQFLFFLGAHVIPRDASTVHGFLSNST